MIAPHLRVKQLRIERLERPAIRPIHCAMRGRRCAVLLTIFIYPLFLVQTVESQHFLRLLSSGIRFQICNFTIHFPTIWFNHWFSLASHQLAQQTNVLQKHLKSHGGPQPKPNHNRTLVDWQKFLEWTIVQLMATHPCTHESVKPCVFEKYALNDQNIISNKPSIGPNITATSRGASKKCNAWFLQSFVQLAQFH